MTSVRPVNRLLKLSELLDQCQDDASNDHHTAIHPSPNGIELKGQVFHFLIHTDLTRSKAAGWSLIYRMASRALDSGRAKLCLCERELKATNHAIR